MALVPWYGDFHEPDRSERTPSPQGVTDKQWEDLQRDLCPFPAYTDYLFGPDTRMPGEDYRANPERTEDLQSFTPSGPLFNPQERTYRNWVMPEEEAALEIHPDLSVNPLLQGESTAWNALLTGSLEGSVAAEDFSRLEIPTKNFRRLDSLNQLIPTLHPVQEPSNESLPTSDRLNSMKTIPPMPNAVQRTNNTPLRTDSRLGMNPSPQSSANQFLRHFRDTQASNEEARQGTLMAQEYEFSCHGPHTHGTCAHQGAQTLPPEKDPFVEPTAYLPSNQFPNPLPYSNNSPMQNSQQPFHPGRVPEMSPVVFPQPQNRKALPNESPYASCSSMQNLRKPFQPGTSPMMPAGAYQQVETPSRRSSYLAQVQTPKNLSQIPILQPGDVLHPNYTWISPVDRRTIDHGVASAWRIIKSPSAEHQERESSMDWLHKGSQMVRVDERKHSIRTVWMPKAWIWLKARSTSQPGSAVHQEATANLEKFKTILNPGEQDVVDNILREMIVAEEQGLDPISVCQA